MYEEILKETAHRKTIFPDSPWIASQLWKDLLFINYPVDPKAVQNAASAGIAVGYI